MENKNLDVLDIADLLDRYISIFKVLQDINENRNSTIDDINTIIDVLIEYTINVKNKLSIEHSA